MFIHISLMIVCNRKSRVNKSIAKSRASMNLVYLRRLHRYLMIISCCWLSTVNSNCNYCADSIFFGLNFFKVGSNFSFALVYKQNIHIPLTAIKDYWRLILQQCICSDICSDIYVSLNRFEYFHSPIEWNCDVQWATCWIYYHKSFAHFSIETKRKSHFGISLCTGDQKVHMATCNRQVFANVNRQLCECVLVVWISMITHWMHHRYCFSLIISYMNLPLHQSVSQF